MSDKIRITLFSKNNLANPESDRLVTFSTEMNAGPKGEHNGPIRLEAMMENQDEVEQMINYLKQLSGKLPIQEKPSRVARTKSSETDSMQKIIDTALDKRTIDEMVKYLRDMNFAFVTVDHLAEICKKNDWEFKLKNEKHEKLQFMVRVLKLAKDPKNDKIDPTVFFGIKLIGKRFNKVHVYVSGQYSSSVNVAWESLKEMNFKVKEKFYKFPEPMSYEERSNWRKEDRKVITSNGEYEGSKFYQKWKPFVTILKPLKIKKRK